MVKSGTVKRVKNIKARDENGRFASNDEEQGPKQVVVTNRKAMGASGIEWYSGEPNEEYLSELSFTRAPDVYNKMKRNEPQVRMILNAIKNPIRAASWEVEPADNEDPLSVQIAEFVEFALMHDIGDPDETNGWKQYLNDSLSVVEYGYSPVEIIDKVVMNHKRFGSYVGVGGLGWRSPRSVEEFNVDPQSGRLVTMRQRVDGDQRRDVHIPAEFLVLHVLDQEGNNYEGISTLRACYGPWKRKHLYKKLVAAGIEKFAIPTPIATIPAKKTGSKEYDNLIDVLEAYTSHQKAFITKPEGWELELMGHEFDPSKVQQIIDGEDKEIAVAALANFLLLGMSGSGGAYALGRDLSDFFLGGIEHIAHMIAENTARRVVRRLVKLNFGPQEQYPTIRVSGVVDKASKEFAEIMSSLITSGALRADDRLEETVRRRYNLPSIDFNTVREKQVLDPLGRPVSPPFNPEPEVDAEPEPDPDPPEDVIEDPEEEQGTATIQAGAKQLAEKPKAQKTIEKRADKMRSFMKDELTETGKRMVKAIMRNYAKLPEARKIDAINGVKPTRLGSYRAKLEDQLLDTGVEAVKEAQKEVPGAPNLFSESQQFQDERKRQMPRRTVKRISKRAALLALTQGGDLEKALFFQFSSSLDSTEDPRILEKDMEEALGGYVTGTNVVAAAINANADIVNGARDDYFNQDDVLDMIESFTFTNPDPQAPICKHLVGKTFEAGDPEADRLKPPLHHNCKSTLRPNPKGKSGNPEVTPGGLSVTVSGNKEREQVLKSITFSDV